MKSEDTVRVISLSLPSEEYAMELLDFIESYDWEKVDVLADYKVGNIKIKIYGPRPFVKKAYYKVKQFIRIVESRYKKDKRGLYSFYYDDLVLLFGSTFRIEMLLDVLEDLGYRVVRISEKHFKTNANLNKIEELVNEIVALRDIARQISASRPVAELLIRASIKSGESLVEVAERAVNEGLLRKNAQERYELAAAPEKFVRKLIRGEKA